MTAARLRLVDESKKDALAGEAKAAAPGTAPGTERRQKRGAGAHSEVVPKDAAPKDAAPKDAAPSARARPRAGKRTATVADLMRSPAVCCGVGDTLHRAAQLMWENDVGSVVVVDADGKACFMLTDRDVCMAAYTQGVAMVASLVTSVRPTHVVACPETAGVVEVRRLMQEHGLRRIPVVDGSGRVLGVIGLGDLIREATATAPKSRTRGLTTAQLAQTLTAVFEDVAVPQGRVQPSA